MLPLRSGATNSAPQQARTMDHRSVAVGTAKAAAAAGDAEKAAANYRKLLVLAESADTQRPEIVQAKAFLAR